MRYQDNSPDNGYQSLWLVVGAILDDCGFHPTEIWQDESGNCAPQCAHADLKQMQYEDLSANKSKSYKNVQSKADSQ